MLDALGDAVADKRDELQGTGEDVVAIIQEEIDDAFLHAVRDPLGHVEQDMIDAVNHPHPERNQPERNRSDHEQLLGKKRHAMILILTPALTPASLLTLSFFTPASLPGTPRTQDVFHD